MTTETLKRELYLHEFVDEEIIAKLIAEIDAINKKDDKDEESVVNFVREPITLNICSVGGACFVGFALVDRILTSTTPINGVISGACMSMAGPIAAACTKRYAYDHTSFMIHDVSSSEYGKLADIESSLNNAKMLRTWMMNIFVKRTKMKKTWLNKIIIDKSDYYFYAKEALKIGLIHEIL